MEELHKQLVQLVHDAYADGKRNARDESPHSQPLDIVESIEKAYKDAGYIHIPTSKGKNVTIYTSDNPEPLMTEQEWREKYGQN